MPAKLIERDWRLIVESIYRINSTQTVWEMECETLRCFRQLIPSTQGTFFIYDDADEEGIPRLIDSTAVDGMEAQYLDRFMTGEYASDRYFKGLVYFRNNPVFRDSDLMPDSYRTGSKLYKDIYEPQGIHWGLRAFLAHKGKLLGNISLFNAKGADDFQDKDVEMLDLIEPHISLKLWELRGREQQHSATINERAGLRKVMTKHSITAREMEVLQLVLSGIDDHAIAAELSISFSTFKKHMSNIYRKLGVSSRIQLYNAVKGDQS